MYEIIPNLFLSNYNDARNQTPPKAFVVNCTRDLPMISNFSIRVPVNDDLSQEAMQGMIASLPSTIQAIDQVLRNGGRVVVHCFAGQQRSAAVVAAYLTSKGIALERAIDYIKSRKQDAFIYGVNFQPALESFVSRRYI